MSTIEVQVTRKHRAAHHDAGGFVGGLQDGWRALGSTAVALGVVLGAVLPFAVVLALLGVAGWIVVRRLSARWPRARDRSAA
jgi:hypothetical protein